MDKLKYLRRFYDLGFAVIWLYPQSKRPIGLDWQTGDRKHFDTLEKTYKEAYNVGVRLGSASQLDDGTYLCVLDCDVKSSEPHYLKEMELALKGFAPSVEYAPRVLSGRGGGSCHVYFRTKTPQQSFKALRSNHKTKVLMPSTPPTDADKISGLTEGELNDGYRMRLAWEIDVYGEGKQVVMPPSIHPDTYRAYEWDSEPKEIEQIPLVANFGLEGRKLLKATEATVEVDYDYTLADCYTLSKENYHLIVYGEKFDERYKSRSEAVMGCLSLLAYAGLKDSEIYAVMTDSDNFISEKPLEAGKGDRDKAAQWLSKQLAKVRADMSNAKDFNGLEADDVDVLLSEAEALEQEEDLVPWVSKLKGKEGAYKSTSYNLALILRHGFREARLFGYNAFTQSMIYLAQPPWGEPSDIGRELVDSDDTQAKIWLSRYYGVETSTHAVNEIITVLANENTFHPVKTYLDALEWDGIERLDTWLSTYLEAEGDPEYLADVGRKTLAAAVNRVYRAGCEFHHMLILEGTQGCGKSSTVKILASPAWFSDSLGDVTNKDIIEVMRGKWLIEVGELAAMNRSSANDMKDFITKNADTHRKAFARRAVTVPRQSILIGTTNDQEYLKDPTGGRRFWPVRVGQVDFKALIRDRDQLWAEAKMCYQLGELLYLDNPKVKAIAESEQYDRAIVDELETKVLIILNSLHMLNEIDFETFFTELCFKYNLKETDYYLQVRCKKIFTKLQYKKIRLRKEGVRHYTWVKKETGHKSYNGVRL